jgi:hypothetical protein
MTGRRIRTTATLVAACATLSGCDAFDVACTDILLPSLSVEVRDASSGAPAARGVTGSSSHESGLSTELSALDDLRLSGDWQRELPGRHTIELRKPGYVADVVHAYVGSDQCHVEPEIVQAEIGADPRAVVVDPVSFTEGPDVGAWPASAGVQVYADTLEIAGFVPTDCKQLRVVAFRLGTGLHVQVEPSDVPLEPCAWARQFEVRYSLPPEGIGLLVTNGGGFPVELFAGEVHPNQG